MSKRDVRLNDDGELEEDSLINWHGDQPKRKNDTPQNNGRPLIIAATLFITSVIVLAGAFLLVKSQAPAPVPVALVPTATFTVTPRPTLAAFEIAQTSSAAEFAAGATVTAGAVARLTSEAPTQAYMTNIAATYAQYVVISNQQTADSLSTQTAQNAMTHSAIVTSTYQAFMQTVTATLATRVMSPRPRDTAANTSTVTASSTRVPLTATRPTATATFTQTPANTPTNIPPTATPMPSDTYTPTSTLTATPLPPLGVTFYPGFTPVGQTSNLPTPTIGALAQVNTRVPVTSLPTLTALSPRLNVTAAGTVAPQNATPQAVAQNATTTFTTCDDLIRSGSEKRIVLSRIAAAVGNCSRLSQRAASFVN